MLSSRVGSITLAILFSLVIPTSNLSAHVEPRADSQTGETVAEELVTFRIRIQNIAPESETPTLFAPGAWVLHSEPDPLFTNGEADRGEGLEMLAEDGDPTNAGRFPARAGTYKLESSKDRSVLILPGRCGLSNFTSLKLPPHLKRPTFPLPLCSCNPTTCSWRPQEAAFLCSTTTVSRLEGSL